MLRADADPALAMLLLTGATGLVGSALLARLTRQGTPVRCLVRDPRRLGAERVRVQIALGDLSDPPSFRNALRGVKTVVHLAASIRDQASGSIEELNGIATWRMVQAAERAGVEHFVFFSALGASSFHRARLFRAKALAEDAVRESSVRSTIFSPSIVYAPGDRWLTMLEHMSLLPVMPMSGRGRALYQPIWADDAADCVLAALAREDGDRRYELAGPDTCPIASSSAWRCARPAGAGRWSGCRPRSCRARCGRWRRWPRDAPFATWDEAELMEISMTSRLGTADAESLGVVPAMALAAAGCRVGAP